MFPVNSVAFLSRGRGSPEGGDIGAAARFPLDPVASRYFSQTTGNVLPLILSPGLDSMNFSMTCGRCGS
jgi:hypothetical protein